MRSASRVAALLLSLFSCHVFSSPCATPEHRQFDFWLGHWAVYTPGGKLAGHNHIRLIEQQCVLHEQYTTPSGYSGQSFTLYHSSRRRWHQTWVDNQGGLLLLEGGLESGKMVLQGQVQGAETAQLNRITWSVQPDGRVRQHWQVRAEDEWKTLFDGYYQRVEPAAD